MWVLTWVVIWTSNKNEEWIFTSYPLVFFILKISILTIYNRFYWIEDIFKKLRGQRGIPIKQNTCVNTLFVCFLFHFCRLADLIFLIFVETDCNNQQFPQVKLYLAHYILTWFLWNKYLLKKTATNMLNW